MHSYPGGLKERTATQVHDKDPSEILRRAVIGMLPKNTLRKVIAWQLCGRVSVWSFTWSLELHEVAHNRD
jgi:ribosomal protein L13